MTVFGRIRIIPVAPSFRAATPHSLPPLLEDENTDDSMSVDSESYDNLPALTPGDYDDMPPLEEVDDIFLPSSEEDDEPVQRVVQDGGRKAQRLHVE